MLPKKGDKITMMAVAFPSSSSEMSQVAFEGEKMTLVAGSRDRWVVLADSPNFSNFHENILSFQVTAFLKKAFLDHKSNQIHIVLSLFSVTAEESKTTL